jgi:hypothetical protein
MPTKRILYFTTNQVVAFTWKAGALTRDAEFLQGDDVPPEFSEYIAGSPQALYYLLVDVVDEDFHQEMIPYVRGGDRRTLLHRKLAQRYRDLSLALTLSLGFETGPRREESILFTSFTNTQQLQPWLLALSRLEARMAGVYSPPLLAPALAKRLGFSQQRFLLVSRQQAGIRQTFVDKGQIRFSRLGQIEGDDFVLRANMLASETSRLQQYLTNMRMLSRDSGALEVIVLCPDAMLQQFQAACVNTAQLNYNLLAMSDACKKVGLKSAPPDSLAETIFAHSLASFGPARQFAVDEHRRFYNLWRARIAAFAAGGAIFLLCALWTSVRLLEFNSLQTQAEGDQQRERQLNEQYARMQSQFPKTPTTTENLKALVKNYIALQKQSITPEKMFVDLSRALGSSPQIELEHIEWQLRSDVPRPAGKPGEPQPAPAAAAAADKSGGAAMYEIVQISGRINAAQSGDYKSITLLVNKFADALRGLPGIVVDSLQLPFDLTAEKSLSGDIGAARESEIPRFTIMLSRRLES